MELKKLTKYITDAFLGKVLDKITYILGIFLSIPVIFSYVLFGYPRKIKYKDFNGWIFGHVFVTYFLAHFLYVVAGLELWPSVALAFGIMYMWELLIDANGLSDFSFSTQDIGADALGVLFFVLVMVIGGKG